MKLVICEKNQIRNAIMDVVPGKRGSVDGLKTKGDYVFAPLGGHALELEEPDRIDKKYAKWSKDNLPVFFENWKKTPIRGKGSLIKAIKKHMKDCEYVIHAGDIDEEGQLLVDEVIEYCGYKGDVRRLNTADLSKKKLKKYMDNLEDNGAWKNLGKSANARQIADKTFGYSLTRYFTLQNTYGEPVHVGRVKIPTLGLVVNRDALIEGHVKQKYYELTCDAKTEKGNIKTLLELDKNSKLLDEEGRLSDRSVLDRIVKCDNVERTGTHTVKNEKEQPPLPFNLTTLNRYAADSFGYTPSMVMSITQELRDNFKAITYNRTDCQYLTEEHYLEAPDTVKQVMENMSLTGFDIDTNRKSRAFNDENVTAHHGIIPTDTALDLTEMTESQFKIYTAIAKFYLTQFMPPCEKEKHEFIVPADGIVPELTEKDRFRAVESRITVKGYRELLGKKEKKCENPVMFELDNGDIPCEMLLEEAAVEEKETKPPKAYTETSLQDDMTRIAKYVSNEKVKELLKKKDNGKKGENGSIGTVATRSVIVQNLLKQGYLEKNGNEVHSTEKARKLLRQLPEEIRYADTTAYWWAVQDEIASGTKEPSELYESVLKTINVIMKRDEKVSIGEEKGVSLGKCPMCGGDIVSGKYGAYCMEKCGIYIKKYRGKALTDNQIKKLLNGECVTVKGLKSKKGKTYGMEIRLRGDVTEKVYEGKNGEIHTMYFPVYEEEFA